MSLELSFPVVDAQELYSGTGKCTYCHIRASDMPLELIDWLYINPRFREVEIKDGEVIGQMAAKIRKTLTDSPESFFDANYGITLLAKDTEITERGGHKWVRVRLTAIHTHGIVDGGRTYHVIRELKIAGQPNLDVACVSMVVKEGIAADRIEDISNGLNTSNYSNIDD